MIALTLLLEATGGELCQPGRVVTFAAFASDSREVAPGDLFVAVRGVHADGHDFALDAVARGASGIILEAKHPAVTNALIADLATHEVTIILVADVRQALRAYAAAVLRASEPQVIAVAGSAGKTTTKEAIATILETQTATFRSWRNFNDLLGVPLSLGRLESRHTHAVLELACDYPNELARLADMTRPSIAVILNASAMRLDGLENIEGVAAALESLPRHMSRADTIVLNADDPQVARIGATISAAHERGDEVPRVVWFGTQVGEIQIKRVTNDLVHGHLCLDIQFGDETRSYVFEQLYGAHWLTTILAALTVAHLLGHDLDASATTLCALEPLPGRMRLLPGAGGNTLLDDSHNAIPAAILAALATLDDLGTLWERERVAILGDMLHLGQEESTYHRIIGEAVARHADWLITRGERAMLIAEAARATGMADDHIIVTQTAEDAANALASLPSEDDFPVVLIKGSPEMRMEQVTERCLADHVVAHEVLDRQRSIWQRAIVGDLRRPTWLEIDLGAIANNVRAVKSIVGPSVAVMATMKADAYGHGAVKVAHTALRNGAKWLGVATVSEADPLRASGITAPILVYGYVPPWQAREAARLDVRVTVYALDTAQALSRVAVALDRTINVHVKVDTGMARLGLRAEHPSEIVEFFQTLHTLPGLVIEGVYTHLATADELDQSYANEQLERFDRVLADLEWHKLRPPIVHAANSATMLAFPQARFDLVRPGVALYGLHPSTEVPLPANFRAAMTFKTQIAQVKEVPAGEGVSYGRTYVTPAPERLAILPVGYADGFRRGPANWGEVLIHGKRAPIRGRVCMDQTIVSVQHIPEARAGDEVVLIGAQGDDRITVEDVATHLGTSGYEVVSALLARVPRIDG